MILPAKFSSVVFDFDGTLAELRLDFGEMRRRLHALAGDFLEPHPDASLPVLEWMELMVTSLRKSDASMAEELDRRSKSLICEMEIESAREGSLFSYTKPILIGLKQKGIKAAVITRNCEEAVRLVFPDIDSFCSGFLSRDHVPRVKPDPDHLLRALYTLNAAPEEALMVGDHPLDILTGKRAGVRTAGVFSGNASKGDLVRSGANWTAGNCEDLFELLAAEELI